MSPAFPTLPPMTTITADLTTRFAVELRAGDHVWPADEPTDLGGTDAGPNPHELLLSGVAQRGPVHKTLDHGVAFTVEAIFVG